MRKKNPTPQESTSFAKIGLAEGWNLMINNNRKHWVGESMMCIPRGIRKYALLIWLIFSVGLLCKFKED